MKTIKLKIDKDFKDDCILFNNKVNLGNRSEGNGDKQKQLEGIIAENAVRNFYGLQPMEEQQKFDGGFDFVINNLSFDVKCSGRSCDIRPHYQHNVYDFQKNYNVDYYLFTSYNRKKDIVEICGTIKKDEFFKKADYKERGQILKNDTTQQPYQQNNWEIKQSQIDPIGLVLPNIPSENCSLYVIEDNLSQPTLF